MFWTCADRLHFISVAASKGLLDAAHFCYLMAQVGLGVFTKKSTKMVLIGSNHRLGMGIRGLCDHKWLFYTTNQPHLSIFSPVWPSPNLQPTKPSRGLRLMSMLSLWAHSHAHYQISRYEFFSIYVTSQTSLLQSPRDLVM